MLFNSLIFLLFAAVFYALWLGPFRHRSPLFRQGVLVVFSLVFYGWWKWAYIGLILASGLIDYTAALAMKRWPASRRWALFASILGNLGILAAFKYAGFLAENLDLLGKSIGQDWGVQGALPSLLDTLPVGISFYTFQSMSYTIDVYRGRLEPTRNIVGFFAYLSLFPQLVAGPIVRASNLLPQVLLLPSPRPEQVREGFILVLSGFVKKVVLADQLAPYVETAFAGGSTTGSPLYWWLVTMMFAVQIYGDFSGYTDIARGLGKWMGFDFDVNFNHPYLARSLRDFWRRWHISLSTWFRDYVYIPLGGSRRGVLWGIGAMAITMVVSGLWHGAAWTFVAWGAIHALVLAVERLGALERRLPPVLVRSYTLLAVLFAWVMFRAESMAQAQGICARMLGLGAEQTPWGHPIFGLFPLSVLLVFVAWEVAVARQWHRPLFRDRLLPWTLAVFALMAVFLRGPSAQFIYFQF
ncbi:MAG: membrane-bound O-acyltransferase family protein [Myxococcales bacterium]|nr:membrane-bound O-acyltransferase family protein [Myxococcales bacterium]